MKKSDYEKWRHKINLNYPHPCSYEQTCSKNFGKALQMLDVAISTLIGVMQDSATISQISEAIDQINAIAAGKENKE